jgi:hypothetical protein
MRRHSTEEGSMSRQKLLQIALVAFGAVFCLVYPLAIVGLGLG